MSKDHTIAFADLQFDGQFQDLPKDLGTKLEKLADDARGNGLTVELGGNVFQSHDVGGASRAGRHPRRHRHPARRVRLGARHGPADHHGAVRHRHRHSRLVQLLTHVVVASPTSRPQLAAMIGIGVGIDYALFIVTRYREGLAEGSTREAAVVHALDTAGRAGAVRRLHGRRSRCSACC